MRLACLLLPLLLAPPALAQRDSVEDLLRRARAEHEAERARVQPEVVELLDQIVTASRAAREREVERLREKLVDLGTVGALVLIESVNVGEAAADAVHARAEEATGLLTRLTRPPLLPKLLELTVEGTERGRVRAIRILGHWPGDPRVESRLIALSAEGRRAERFAAVEALARLGGERAAERFGAILADDSDPDLLEQALVEIGRYRKPELTELVTPLLRNSNSVLAHLDALLDFFTAAPEQMSEERAVALLELIDRRRLDGDEAVATLERLGRFELSLRGPVGDLLERLEQFGRSQIAEAATVAMALLGDSSALRRLEDAYTERIEESRDPDDFRRYAARAAMYLRVDESKKARRDFEKAIDLDGGWGGPVDQSLYIGLARSLARQDDLRQAADALEAARLGPALIETLSADPDFAALRASRYGDVLR